MYGDNWHKNFVDLNPVYANERHDRAVKRANVIVEDMGKYLVENYKDKLLKVRKMKWILGKRLDYLQLQKLSTHQRNEYGKVVSNYQKVLN